VADPKNKWSQPAAPPAPMFFGKKERDLVKQVNDELAERVIGQPIAYYPISIEESNFNDVYGEAIEKVSLPPIRVFAYVEVSNEQTHDRYGYEYQSKLTVNFNRKRLVDDQNLFVRVGDFVQYGDEFYEIVRTYNDTRYYFGQVEHKFQISAECIAARAGTFKVMPAIDRPVDAAALPDGSSPPAPRPAPYPPLAATYITVTADTKLPNERVLTAGTGITITDGGANSTITVASTAQSAAGLARQLQFNDGAAAFAASANLTFLTSSNLLQVTGTVAATNYTGSLAQLLTLSASLMNLAPTSGTLAGAGSYLGLDADNNIVVTASAGSDPGGSNTQVQYNDGGSFGASSAFTFDGTTVSGSFSGSLAQLMNLSASLMTLLPTSGTLAGPASYLGLDVNNNVILSAGDGATTSPAAPVNSVQFNDAGAFGGSSNLTFDGTSLGIGTDAPDYTLDVAGDAGFNEYIYHNEDPDTYIRFAPNLVNVVAGGWSAIKLEKSTGIIQLNNTNQDLDLQVMADDGEVILHTDAGTNRVGIGTDAPDYTLDVAGDAGFNEYIYHNENADNFIQFEKDGSKNNINIEVGGENMLYIVQGSSGDQADKVTINNALKDVDFQVKGSGEANLIRTDAANDMVGIGHHTTVAALLHVSSSGDQQLFRVDGATSGSILFVTGSGRVGIGTNIPSATLHVSSSGDAGLLQVDGAVSGTILYVTGNIVSFDGLGPHAGGVGINTDTPRGLLHIRGPVFPGEITSLEGITLHNHNNYVGDNMGIYWRRTSDGRPEAFIKHHDYASGYRASLKFGTADGPKTSVDDIDVRMTINPYGAIGIGTETPSTSRSGSLHISASAGEDFSGDGALFRVDGFTQGIVLFVTGSGRVGIGTDAPTSTLHVVGDVTASIGLSGSLVQATTLSASAGRIAGDFHIDGTEAGASASPTDGRLVFNNQFDGTGETTANKIVLYDSPGTSARYGIGISSGDFDFFAGQGGSYRFFNDHVDESTPGDEVLTIRSDGKLGVGQSLPTRQLEVNGNLYCTASFQINDPHVSTILSGPDAAVRLIGNSASTQTPETLLRLTRPGASGQYYPPVADFNISAYDVGGSPYGPYTQLDINLKSVGSWAESASVNVMSFRDNGNVGVGTRAPSHNLSVVGDTYLSGGLVHKRVTIATSYTASVTDYILGVASVPTSIEFDATSFADGQALLIKDETGNASVSNAIVLTGAWGQTIDGDVSVDIDSPHGAVFLYSDGSNWFIY